MILKLASKYGFLTYLSLIIIFQVVGLFSFHQLSNTIDTLKKDPDYSRMRVKYDHVTLLEYKLHNYSGNFELVYIVLACIGTLLYAFTSKDWFAFLGKSFLTSSLVWFIGHNSLHSNYLSTYECDYLCGIQFFIIYLPLFLFVIIICSIIFYIKQRIQKKKADLLIK